MDPALYPDPERFDPRRFIGRGPGAAEFFPFGGGARRCLGATLAMAELKIVSPKEPPTWMSFTDAWEVNLLGVAEPTRE